MLTSTRRFASHSRFAGRNRLAISAATALDQTGGMLVNPIALVAICSLLTADLSRMVIPAVVAPVCWIVGYRAVPVLLARAGRKLPWAIGASIVRAASLALLAYVMVADDATRDERLRSITICIAAYALSAGLARAAAESLAPRVTEARRQRRSDSLAALIPAALALVVGLGSFTLLIDAPRAPLSRLAVLVGVAAALSGAAVLALAWVVEFPRVALPARRATASSPAGRRQLQTMAWMLLSATIGAIELLVLVGLIRSMELQRAFLLSGIGVVLVSSAIAAAVLGLLVPALPLRVLMQLSVVLSGIAFALAIGLPTLVDVDQWPDQLFGRRSDEVAVWGTMALIGVAQQARRRVLPKLSDLTRTSPNLINVTGLALALVPLPTAVVFEGWEVRSWLLIGLALALLGIAMSGLISPQRARGSTDRLVAARRGASRAGDSLGSRTTP